MLDSLGGADEAEPAGSRAHPANVCPVSRSYASTYRERVRSTTSAGSSGGASTPFRSHPDAGDVSQSRTNCLSKLGWARPGSQVSAGQNRDESG